MSNNVTSMLQLDKKGLER